MTHFFKKRHERLGLGVIILVSNYEDLSSIRQWFENPFVFL